MTVDQARSALCGLPRLRDINDLFPCYVAYQCPSCLQWHQAWGSRPLLAMLALFPGIEIVR